MERTIKRVTPQIIHLTALQLKRVAAYARVSDSKVAMLHSLSAQISHYSGYIQKQRGWQYVGVYADEAVTGTKDSRAEFQRLLADCRAGKIDMIITKSITRFARNTVTLLETVRELKLLGIDVFFEKENIHSMSGDGEVMLSILASYAQEESRSVSENCKWRIRKRLENGEVVSLRYLYGYNIKKGVVEIDPERAETVKMIFTDYLDGMGGILIARRLNEAGIPSFFGGRWTANRVHEIIRNEKFMGDALGQKSFIADHLTKKSVRNKGQLPQYYAEDVLPAIIEKATFEAAQRVMAGRREHFNIKDTSALRYPFTGKILCDNCGKRYKRKKGVGRFYWQCYTFLYEGKAVCPAKQIPEETLYTATAEVLGLPEFDAAIFAERIAEIRVTEANKLLFVFHDGRTLEHEWQDRSRRESWTDEMRQTAREHALRGHKLQGGF